MQLFLARAAEMPSISFLLHSTVGGGTFIVQARLSWLLGAKKGHSLPDAVHVSRQIYGNPLIHPIPVPQAPFLYSPVPRSLSLPLSRSTNPLATAGSQPYVTIATADV